MRCYLHSHKNSSKWQAKIVYKDPTTGERKSITRSTGVPIEGSNKRKANERVKELLEEFKYLEMVASPDMLFSDLLDMWLENYQEQHKMNHPDEREHTRGKSTVKDYVQYIDKHIKPFFAGKQIKDLTSLDFQRYVNEKQLPGGSLLKGRGLKGNSILKHFGVLSMSMKYAKKHRLIVEDPTPYVELPSATEAEIDPLTKDEMQVLMSNLKGKSPLLIALVLFASLGLRRSEICGMKYCNIHPNTDPTDPKTLGTFEICFTVVRTTGEVIEQARTKTKNSRRTLKLTKPLIVAIEALRAEKEKNREFFGDGFIENDFLFCEQNGKRIDPDKLTVMFRDFIATVPVKRITLHGMRHSAASIMYEHGNYEEHDFCNYFGWKSTKMYNTYVTIVQERRNRMTDDLTSFYGVPDDILSAG